MSMSVFVRLVVPWDSAKVHVQCTEGAKLRDVLEDFRKREQELEKNCPDGMKKLLKSVLQQKLDDFVKSSVVLLNQKHVAASEGGLDEELLDGDEMLVIPPIVAG